MALFEWSEELSTGIQIVDEQHKRLVALINQLHDSMVAGKGRETVAGVIRELFKYTDYHFGTEERAFDAYGYPQTETHKKQHSELIKRLAALTQEMQAGKFTVTMDTLDFLIAWLKQHILVEDKAYVPFLKDKDI